MNTGFFRRLHTLACQIMHDDNDITRYYRALLSCMLNMLSYPSVSGYGKEYGGDRCIPDLQADSWKPTPLTYSVFIPALRVYGNSGPETSGMTAYPALFQQD